MSRLILIRHGETSYHSENRYCGFSNPPLNKNGIRQCESLSRRLNKANVHKVYSSNLKRALETARIIFKNNAIEQLPDFREMNFGILEGLTHQEIMNQHPRLYQDWLSQPAKLKFPGGETLKDLVARVRKQLSFILARNRQREIALIAHGGPIRVILSDVLKLGLDSFWEINQEFTALNVIDYPQDAPPKVVIMNDTTHLITREATAG